MLIEIKLPF